ncbi:hypothetical protein VTN77DRAFT_2759 [Rasamsonia byssochlamydoides]|uniref:uncharacterized protein n=1 Tax=Rasamsonia byssochlamydoides TaxID=89139 RepID=UPI00374306CE
MGSFYPRTPTSRTGQGLHRLIEDLNFKFDIRIPNPLVSSPSSRERDKPLDVRCFLAIKQLYFNKDFNIYRILEDFEERVRVSTTQWVAKPRQEPGTLPSSNDFLRRDGYRSISEAEREKRLKILLELLDDWIYLMRGGSFSPHALDRPCRPRDLSNGPPRLCDHARPRALQPETKRKSIEDEEVFHTARNSPIIPPDEGYPSLGNQDEFEDFVFDAIDTDDFILDDDQKPESPKKSKKRQSRISDYMTVVKTDTSPSKQTKAAPASENESTTTSFARTTSFATTVVSDIFDSRESRTLGTSFDTDITEPIEKSLTQASSTVGLMLSEEVTNILQAVEAGGLSVSRANLEQDIAEQKLLDDLRENGPFAKRATFPSSVSLRARYELERIAQEWKIPPKQVLAGDRVPFNNHEDFWKWVEGHNQRHGKALPEKSPAKAWDAAVNLFKVVDKHSEVVVFTGALDWCDKSEAGIFKLKLNPLRTERSCRFHRRFGSDRFLSVTIPAPSRPPAHLRFDSHPSFLRESIAKWLTHYDHYLLGRTWRAFYVEEVKTKGKKKTSDIRFRVEFFAVDGIDFDHSHSASSRLAPIDQPVDKHTPMTAEALLDWHMPRHANLDQTDCKLFQRIALGLSKTWATVVLRPEEVLHLKDDKNKPVMNDGCALMSRALAREICDHLGLSGGTPSCFQGRIAGAKGLWMVDRQNSPIKAGDRDFWIQISDSQLKVKPHPHYWSSETTDDEQLTFEVANWPKELHPVELNMQLLNILEQGGHVREYVAEVMRNGIRQTYEDFAKVIEKGDLCRARLLVHKLRPGLEDAFSRNSFRRIDQWILDDTECIIRLLDAGFSPRNFPFLRKRLRQYLRYLLDRYVKELHIPIPLSTYAYCIADPYGVLGEDEVHFGFSHRWQDVNFDDTMLDGVDVLVGRLPAHRPSDIQRRRAVWKHELRHFKDVIVFSSRGDTPLASLLSGGDYDGDKPWICWDQRIVQSFKNAPPPPPDHPPEYFGLTKHSRPMREVQSMGDFLEKTFMFNLTLSNLGRCTVEHEKIVYDEDESVNSAKAQELAMLLSHLVDGRKGGLQLSEKAWQEYRKKISPRKREVPAYKDTSASKWKASNIIDYLKFEVAQKETHHALEQLHTLCEGFEDGRDADLLRPWQKAWTRADREKRKASNEKLYNALQEIQQRVKDAHNRWMKFCGPKKPFNLIVQRAADLIREIQPPTFDHPLGHTWQNSEYEWRMLLASCTYNSFWRSKFPWYAVGETLCRIKTGDGPARLVCEAIYQCLKVNSKVSRRLAAMEVDDDDAGASDEFEGKEAIEEFLSRDDWSFTAGLATLDYFDDEDGLSVE